MRRFLLPLGVFAVLLLFLGFGLRLDPRAVPSPFIGKAAPGFAAGRLDDGDALFSPADMAGKVWVLNVWASWCAACRVEHPVLMDFSRRGVAPLVGLNYKDRRVEATGWLRQHGDPYVLSVFDGDGRIGIDYGVYGVPETFVIDRQGVIRMKHVGPVTQEFVVKELVPLIEELNRA